MLKWLEGEKDRLSDEVLWRYKKGSYAFKDLKVYMENNKKRGKGKGKVRDEKSDGSPKKKRGNNSKMQV